MSRPTRLCIDVSDLFGWFGKYSNPSGIQRVLVELGRRGLPENSSFVRLNAARGSFETLHAEPVVELCRYISGGSISRADLTRRLGAIRVHSPLKLQRTDTLYLPGAFWSVQRGGPLRAAKKTGTRIAALVYDLIPIRHPEFCGGGFSHAFQTSLNELLPLLDHAQAISEYSAADLRRYLAGRNIRNVAVTVQPLAHELPATAPGEPSVRTRSITQQPFALCVGTIDRRKNQRLLLDVWDRLVSDMGPACPQLVLVGGAWGSTDVHDRLRRSRRLADLVTILNDATDTDLVTLYDGCMFTLCASLCEGWGLPVGESLARGKLCICSNATSLPEVGGDLAVYFDAADGDDAYRVISDYALSPELLAARTERVRLEFIPRTWSSVCTGIYRDLAARFGTGEHRC